jgi:hypothetical protein
VTVPAVYATSDVPAHFYGRLLPVVFWWSVAVAMIAQVASARSSSELLVAVAPSVTLNFEMVNMASALLGAFAVYWILGEDASRRRMALWLGVGMELFRLAVFVMEGQPVGMPFVLSIGFGFGAATFVTLILTAVRAHAERRRAALERTWAIAQLALIVPLAMSVLPFWLALGIERYPSTYDGTLYRIDSSMGVLVPALVAQIVERVPLLGMVMNVVYASLPLAIASALGLGATTSSRRTGSLPALNLLLAFVVAGIAARVVCYSLAPAAGPRFAFGSAFPFSLPAPDTVSSALAPFAPLAWRNSVPSLHVGMTLLLFRATQGESRPIHWAAGAFLVGTVLATLGLGEHYLIDLIMALPFVLFVEGICRRDVSRTQRVRATLVGAAIVSAWLLAIRAGPSTVSALERVPGLTVGLILATLVVSFVAVRRLTTVTDDLAI